MNKSKQIRLVASIFAIFFIVKVINKQIEMGAPKMFPIITGFMGAIGLLFIQLKKRKRKSIFKSKGES